jgi:prepilin-type N-terminal cleavage/methylation domain-containing protein
MKKIQKGFTLIELLIVIAITGILAGVILVSTSSARSKAVVAAARQVGKSVMPYVAECLASGGTVQTASNGGAVCAPDLKSNYPDLSTSTTLSSCTYTGSSATQVKIDCGAATGNTICTANTGSCT